MSNLTLQIIKDSFERWYNKNVSKSNPVAVIINYKDTQTLAIKAYHTAVLEMQTIGIKSDMAVTTPLITLKENYNHGVITEEEAKESLLEKLLEKLYSYRAEA